ncbi:hypothetical protein [Natronococcus occultus]|uniref:Uncharacterized protein n=1 Tax=Natronococcus occultus SP4 TaxID=694430 RepID=L0JY28_9EURY|nr:hypothetical protein [Natronococcus occultus]AGB37014.1 hypothetical protein Natoc_1177 [Natronococcus occultus SP4]
MTSTDNEDDLKSVNIEVPGAEKKRYVSVDMPRDQYERLDELKSRNGLTWRGLLMHTLRSLGSLEPDGGSQYEQLNETRQRHGFTWKGMLLYAARDLEDN